MDSTPEAIHQNKLSEAGSGHSIYHSHRKVTKMYTYIHIIKVFNIYRDGRDGSAVQVSSTQSNALFLHKHQTSMWYI